MDLGLKHHVVTVVGSVAQLECTEAFKLLTHKERLYAYHVGKGAWEGAKICLLQTSAESPAIFRCVAIARPSRPASAATPTPPPSPHLNTLHQHCLR